MAFQFSFPEHQISSESKPGKQNRCPECFRNSAGTVPSNYPGCDDLAQLEPPILEAPSQDLEIRVIAGYGAMAIFVDQAGETQRFFGQHPEKLNQ